MFGYPFDYTLWDKVKWHGRRIKWWFTDPFYRKHGWLPHWNLDTYVIMQTLPHLKKLRNCNMGYPSELSGPEKWEEILDELITGFELYLNEDTLPTEEENKKIEATLDLFRKYFRNLWD